MKKTLGIIMTLLLGLTLVACKGEDKPGKDSTPVLTGVESVQIYVGDDFDPRAGVSATDSIDGDITDQITIDGEVNVNRAGTYTLVYEVVNSSNKSAKRNRVIIVEGLGGLVNGDFLDGLTGWENWVNSSQDVEAEFSTEGNMAVVDIIKQSIVKDNNWWDVQLSQKTLRLEAFKSYTLKFTVKADNERKMMLNVQGGGLPKKPIGEVLISITQEETEHSFDFFTTMDAEGVELQFALGTFHKVANVPEDLQNVLGKVYFKDVKIVAGPELVNQAPILEATDIYLIPGTTDFIIKQGLKVSDDRDALSLVDVEFEDISEGAKFALPAIEGIYKIKYSVTDSGGLTTEVVRTITVAPSFKVPVLSEDSRWTIWYQESTAGLEATFAEEIVELDIKAFGTKVWDNKFETKLAGLKGKYRLSFDIKADLPRPVRVAMEQGGISNIAKNFDITTEWVTQTWDFDEILVDITTFSRTLGFWFGDFSGQEGYTEDSNVLTKVYIKNIVINPIE